MKSNILSRLRDGMGRRIIRSSHDRRILSLVKEIRLHEPQLVGKPVIFFNASTRLSELSLNAAFSLLSSWSLRLSGIPVIYYYCQQGLPLCVLGTKTKDMMSEPPCQECIHQSEIFFSNGNVVPFDRVINPELNNQLKDKSVKDLMNFLYKDIPLGSLVLPSVRWILRKHTLEDDPVTRSIFSRYICGAWNIFCSFSSLCDQAEPRAVVLFNGMSFPEATARWTAQKRGIKVITHEVCLQPYSAFFSTGDATLRVIDIPQDFELSTEQNQRLDKYLEQRFKGNFKMAGIQFWDEMQNPDHHLLEKAGSFQQTVSIFSNVIFDTSQSHANTIFQDMFAWLDLTTSLVRNHPDTLFVYRAHPDEGRPGKESQESVANWIKRTNLDKNNNVVFIPSNARISSYELIRHSKFVMVYNSTIGLEASLMGAPVLCAGRSRFTDYPTVFFPKNRQDFLEMAESFIKNHSIIIPDIFKTNARKYLFYELYRASLPFDAYLDEDPYWQGYVTLRDFSWEKLLPENSVTMNTILEGICSEQSFLLKELN